MSSCSGTVVMAVIAAALGLTIPVARAADIAVLAATCAACHGADGTPVSDTIPNIWGQKEGYIYIELRDMKSGARKNDLMAPIVASLSKDDMVNLAAYFSGKAWPRLKNAPSTDIDAKIAGKLDTSIGCTACHGAQYQGDSTVPRLAGQGSGYLATQMLAFRSNVRGNNPGMTALMKAADKADLQAMAVFLGNL